MYAAGCSLSRAVVLLVWPLAGAAFECCWSGKALSSVLHMGTPQQQYHFMYKHL